MHSGDKKKYIISQVVFCKVRSAAAAERKRGDRRRAPPQSIKFFK
jgi:hypothetical protein